MPSKKRSTVRKSIARPFRKAVDARRITSEKGHLNWWDWTVASIDSAVAWTIAKIVLAIGFAVELLDSSSDQLIPSLKAMPKEDKPFWVTILVGLAIGGLILIGRRKKGKADGKTEEKA
ncbi:hypothetical protein SH668x_001246 [Planctomicrobium sp. SH668]|uniref:hypothetical protein n=1 Tax=Planctomicrobium sp. SH668 TaxID=3448126 RepID=UPI003F5C1302